MHISRLPTYFLSHGGGPWPWMRGDFVRMFDKLEQTLIEMHAELDSVPKAILVISGHWEERGGGRFIWCPARHALRLLRAP